MKSLWLDLCASPQYRMTIQPPFLPSFRHRLRPVLVEIDRQPVDLLEAEIGEQPRLAEVFRTVYPHARPVFVGDVDRVLHHRASYPPGARGRIDTYRHTIDHTLSRPV